MGVIRHKPRTHRLISINMIILILWVLHLQKSTHSCIFLSALCRHVFNEKSPFLMRSLPSHLTQLLSPARLLSDLLHEGTSADTWSEIPAAANALCSRDKRCCPEDFCPVPSPGARPRQDIAIPQGDPFMCREACDS